MARHPGSLKERLRDGERLLGSFVQTPHPVVAEFMGGLGFDFLCVEAEHSPMDVGTVQALVAAAELAGVPSLVRVAGNEATLIAAALDSNAVGVIVPRIGSGAEAAEAAAASRYPPVGVRGAGPGRAARYGLDLRRYVSEAAQQTVVAVQVETRSGVGHLDEILETEGIDLVFVGPGDLALSHGLGPEDASLGRLVQDILDRASAAGRLTGIFTLEAADAARWHARGVELVILGSDLQFIAAGARQARAEVEAVLLAECA